MQADLMSNETTPFCSMEYGGSVMHSELCVSFDSPSWGGQRSCLLFLGLFAAPNAGMYILCVILTALMAFCSEALAYFRKRYIQEKDAEEKKKWKIQQQHQNNNYSNNNSFAPHERSPLLPPADQQKKKKKVGGDVPTTPTISTAFVADNQDTAWLKNQEEREEEGEKEESSCCSFMTFSDFVPSLLYGLQMTFAYMLMLLVMSFDVIIIAAILVAFILSHALFSVYLPKKSKMEKLTKQRQKFREREKQQLSEQQQQQGQQENQNEDDDEEEDEEGRSVNHSQQLQQGPNKIDSQDSNNMTYSPIVSSSAEATGGALDAVFPTAKTFGPGSSSASSSPVYEDVVETTTAATASTKASSSSLRQQQQEKKKKQQQKESVVAGEKKKKYNNNRVSTATIDSENDGENEFAAHSPCCGGTEK